MGIWITVLITLMVIGSVSWAMPSPRDKRLAAMRSQALKCGLTVRLVDQKLSHSLFPWLKENQGYVLYEKPLLSGSKHDAYKMRVVRLSEDVNAHEIDQQDDLKEFFVNSNLLLDLPSSAEAIVMTSSSMALLWKEQNSVDDVVSIERCLTNCMLRTK